LAFQLKNFVSITASMINRMKASTAKITDYHVGSIARTMVEAPAAEIDELYQQVFVGLKEAIPVATYNSFNFSALGAIAATGVIGLTITAQASDVTVASGTVCSYTNGATTFTVFSDVTITAGSTTASLPVIAAVSGAVGNVSSGTSFSLAPSPSGFVSATNAAPFVGRDAETADQRKQRFNQYITTLQRGTVAALIYGSGTVALYDVNGIQTESVKSVSVVEPWIADSSQPISLVNVFIHNGAGSTSSDLVTKTSQVLYGYTDAGGNKVPGWKAAGVKVVVAAATEVVQNIAATLTAEAGYDHDSLAYSAQSVISAYALSLGIGETFQRAQAIFLVKSITGVDNFILTTPSTDATATSSQKIMPGTITIG